MAIRHKKVPADITEAGEQVSVNPTDVRGDIPRYTKRRRDSTSNIPLVGVYTDEVKSREEVETPGGCTLIPALDILIRLYNEGRIDYVYYAPEYAGRKVKRMQFYAADQHVQDYTSTQEHLESCKRQFKKIDEMTGHTVCEDPAKVFIDTVKLPEDDRELRIGKIELTKRKR
jgi:hypothetical protein